MADYGNLRYLLKDPCVYCYEPANGLDHIVPKSRKGRDGWQNRAPACVRCDNQKGNESLLWMLMQKQQAGLREVTKRQKRRSDRTLQMLAAFDKAGGWPIVTAIISGERVSLYG